MTPGEPYRFAMPPTWREAKVANILSGNYCQPRCAEPWIEVIFENEAEGKAQVVVSPLVRLTNRKGVKIEEIGPPAGIITSLGPFITGGRRAQGACARARPGAGPALSGGYRAEGGPRPPPRRRGRRRRSGIPPGHHASLCA